MRRLIIASLLLAAPAAATAGTLQSAALRAMSPDTVLAKTDVLDDPLEHDVAFSTKNVHNEGWKFLKPYGADNHLVAKIDRKTGEVRFQVRQTLRYWGLQRDYYAAQFVGSDGLRKVALSEARHGKDVCPDTENMLECPLSKHMAFDLTEDQVRAIAASYRPGSAESWGFKMKDNTGHDLVSDIAPAEAAGLLMAVDRYRSKTSI